MFIDNVMTDRSRRMKCKGLYLARIQRNAAKLNRQLFSVQIDYHLNHSAKATEEFLKVKKWDIHQQLNQSPDTNQIEDTFQLLNT